MGVEARIILYAPDEPTARCAARAAFDRINALDGVMSDWRRDSELSRLNRQAGSGPVPVSDDLLAVIARARTLAQQTDGAYDPTVGPLVALWRQARETGRLPEPEAIVEARSRVGWDLIDVQPFDKTIGLTQPSMSLDLGGIGKGFAADAALDTLRRLGLTQCLVDLGGDLAVGASPPDRPGWRVALPMRDEHGRSIIVLLAGVGIATSGSTTQYVDIDGTRYAHIIDPATGLGLTNLTVATVIAADAATADALASAVCVLGPARGVALIERTVGTSCLVLTETDGTPQLMRSDTFPITQGPANDDASSSPISPGSIDSATVREP
jgi:thiamine biosynthesis lipoprotein